VPGQKQSIPPLSQLKCNPAIKNCTDIASLTIPIGVTLRNIYDNSLVGDAQNVIGTFVNDLYNITVAKALGIPQPSTGLVTVNDGIKRLQLDPIYQRLYDTAIAVSTQTTVNKTDPIVQFLSNVTEFVLWNAYRRVDKDGELRLARAQQKNAVFSAIACAATGKKLAQCDRVLPTSSPDPILSLPFNISDPMFNLEAVAETLVFDFPACVEVTGHNLACLKNAGGQCVSGSANLQPEQFDAVYRRDRVLEEQFAEELRRGEIPLRGVVSDPVVGVDYGPFYTVPVKFRSFPNVKRLVFEPRSVEVSGVVAASIVISPQDPFDIARDLPSVLFPGFRPPFTFALQSGRGSECQSAASPGGGVPSPEVFEALGFEVSPVPLVPITPPEFLNDTTSPIEKACSCICVDVPPTSPVFVPGCIPCDDEFDRKNCDVTLEGLASVQQLCERGSLYENVFSRIQQQGTIGECNGVVEPNFCFFDFDIAARGIFDELKCNQTFAAQFPPERNSSSSMRTPDEALKAFFSRMGRPG